MATTKEKIASGNRLKIFREKQELTQEQFAEQLDVSVSTVKKMEAGEYNISLDTQRKLKKTYRNVSIDYLLFGEKESVNDLWSKILLLEEFEKLILFQKLMAYFGLSDKAYANKEIDENNVRRLIQYLQESFKD